MGTLGPGIQSFAEFWPLYLGEHRRPACRAIHYAAGLTSIGLVAWALTRGPLLLLGCVPVVSYGLAWFGHILVERNRPATWSYPGWSLRAEYRMLLLAVTGRLGGELRRVFGSTTPGPDDPMLTDR